MNREIVEINDDMYRERQGFPVWIYTIGRLDIHVLLVYVFALKSAPLNDDMYRERQGFPAWIYCTGRLDIHLMLMFVFWPCTVSVSCLGHEP